VFGECRKDLFVFPQTKTRLCHLAPLPARSRLGSPTDRAPSQPPPGGLRWLDGLLGGLLRDVLRAGLARPEQAPLRPVVPRGRRLLPGGRRRVLRLRRRCSRQPDWEEPGITPVVSGRGFTRFIRHPNATELAACVTGGA